MTTKIYNEHYVVGRDDGSMIDVVKITDSLYLVNGMFCAVHEDLDMHKASDLDVYLSMANNPIAPYRGSDDGFIIVPVRNRSSSRWTFSEPNIEHLSDDVQENARLVLNEYKKRTGI